jgi:transposase
VSRSIGMSKTTNKFSPEVRERAVRMVGEHRADYRSEWEAMVSIASKIGCTAETLRRWCRDEASRLAGPAAMADDDRARLKLLEREVKELRRANEILRKASAYFAMAELDRPGRWRSSTAPGDGGARPPRAMTKPALSVSRGRSSTRIERSWGSSRSAGNWRSPPPRIISMPRALPTRAGVPLAPGGTTS